MKIPLVDLSECILCGVCIEISPGVFKMNDSGFIEVLQLDAYPEGEVDEAIKNCPTSCIYWEEG